MLTEQMIEEQIRNLYKSMRHECLKQRNVRVSEELMNTYDQCHIMCILLKLYKTTSHFISKNGCVLWNIKAKYLITLGYPVWLLICLVNKLFFKVHNKFMRNFQKSTRSIQLLCISSHHVVVVQERGLHLWVMEDYIFGCDYICGY